MRRDGAISPQEMAISTDEIAISPREISLREISLPEISEAEAALRRRMRGWMEQYRAAVDRVQEQVLDGQMAIRPISPYISLYLPISPHISRPPSAR